MYTKQQRIAELAKQSPQMGFTSLAYLMDIDWLREAYRRTRKDGAVGVDGLSAAEYERDLEANLQSLLDRAKSGTYQAPPVRRVYIPKGGSTNETRPIGIPTLEDKILQRAVVMLLEPIYEQDFYDCSYGFRPGRSPHGALDAFWKQAMDSAGGMVLEVDIRKFFDTLDHAHLRELLRRRVRDGVLLRLIGKWLKAGVLPDKTRLVPFHRPPVRSSGHGDELGSPGTFDLLGFTHYWGRSLKGTWVVKRKTARSRLTRAIRTIAQWCRRHRHQPIGKQQQTLCQKLRGHFAYYGITGNVYALTQFRTAVVRCWRKWLNRRNRERTLDWTTFNRVLERYPLPAVRVVHSVYAHAAKP